MQALWRREGVSNNALLVAECDGAIAPERVRRALARLLEACPWPGARLTRTFPRGTVCWVAGRRTPAPPPVRHRSVATSEELHAALEAEIDAAIDPRREPPLRLLCVDVGSERDRPASWLVLTWFHPLMDPRGGQNLLTHLAALAGDECAAPRRNALPAFVPPPDRRPLAERGRIARRSLAHLRTLATLTPVSPGTSLAAPGRARFRQESFAEPEEAPRGGRITGEICWRLAVVGKAMADLWRRRGLPAGPFLVPVAVDLRPKGEPGATFGNLLAFHFACFSPSETGDVAHLAATLRRQMADAVRDGLIDASAVAMEFLHYRPISRMLRLLPGTARRETFSFNCADVGELPPALGSLFGRRVLNAYHVPAVVPRPGIGVFFNRCWGRNNLVVSWIEGAVGDDEVTRIIEIVREGMGWSTAPPTRRADRRA